MTLANSTIQKALEEAYRSDNPAAVKQILDEVQRSDMWHLGDEINQKAKNAAFENDNQHDHTG